MNSPLPSPAPPRSPWQLVYGLAHRLRQRWYAPRAVHLPRPVLSVGNLHWGGSGKTPMVAAVATHLRDQGLRVAILSRGYGSKGQGVRVVSTGEGPMLGPMLAGDEPVLLAGELPGVAVVVSPQRGKAGQHAMERLSPKPDLFLLDDGFSHLGLARDLDLLTFPLVDPFAGGRLPPAGRLREPLASVRRAHAVLITGAPPDTGLGQELARSLRQHGFEGHGFASETVAETARREPSGEALGPCRVLTVAAIARPARFLASVREQGFEIAEHVELEDHHSYPQSSLEQLALRFRRCGAEVVLTTGKDLVKLQGRLELPLAQLPIRARPESAFFGWLDQRLAAIRNRAAGS